VIANRSFNASTAFTTSSLPGPFPGRKSVRRREDFVGPAEFGVLLAQPAQLLGLGRRRAVVALAMVGLGLADPVPQRFVMHAQLLGEAPDDGLRSDSR
jgi:hypothetical protein